MMRSFLLAVTTSVLARGLSILRVGWLFCLLPCPMQPRAGLLVKRWLQHLAAA